MKSRGGNSTITLIETEAMSSRMFWPERHRQRLVIGWNVVVFVLCIVALLTTRGSWFHRLVTPIPLSFAAVIAINKAVERHRTLRLKRRFAHFPTSFEVVSRDGWTEETIVSVELGNGDTLIVRVAGADYYPAEDDGEAVMRVLHPEIYA